MNSLRFEWDPGEAAANFKKPGVSSDEARTVFFDERARLIDDPDHSGGVDRLILLGLSSAMRVVLVCRCLRGEGQLICIISARKATPREPKSYAGGG